MLIMSRTVCLSNDSPETIQIKIQPSDHPTYITVRVTEVRGNSVRMGFETSRTREEVQFLRGEVLEKLMCEGGEW